MSYLQTGYRAVAVALLGIALARSSFAGILNGDFQSGDLTGWAASAIDGAGNPAVPLISVGTAAGNRFALLDTGDFASGTLISTLEQSFQVDAATPFLTFDFSRLFTVNDATGSGAGSFVDAFAVGLQSGADFFELLLLDQHGPLADPFRTAPGTVTVGVPLSSGFDFTFTAELSALVGHHVTLFADLINEDDGFRSNIWWDNVATRTELLQKRQVPEPSAVTLWSLLLLIGAGAHGWQQRARRTRMMGAETSASAVG